MCGCAWVCVCVGVGVHVGVGVISTASYVSSAAEPVYRGHYSR